MLMYMNKAKWFLELSFVIFFNNSISIQSRSNRLRKSCMHMMDPLLGFLQTSQYLPHVTSLFVFMSHQNMRKDCYVFTRNRELKTIVLVRLHLLGLDGQVILWATAHPFDFSSYELSAHLKKTGCIGTTWGARTISILTVNINLGLEILNVRFCCHLTPNVFVYTLVPFQSNGCHLESHTSKTSPPAIKHETLVQGAILELSTFHSKWRNFWEILK